MPVASKSTIQEGFTDDRMLRPDCEAFEGGAREVQLALLAILGCDLLSRETVDSFRGRGLLPDERRPDLS